MQIGMNEFDHCILVLLEQQRERPEKFKHLHSLLLSLHRFINISLSKGIARHFQEVHKLFFFLCSISSPNHYSKVETVIQSHFLFSPLPFFS